MRFAGYTIDAQALGEPAGSVARILGPGEPALKEHELKILEPAFEQAQIQERPVHGKECLAEALASYRSHPHGPWHDYVIDRPDFSDIGVNNSTLEAKTQRGFVIDARLYDTISRNLKINNITIPRDPGILNDVFAKDVDGNPALVLPYPHQIFDEWTLANWPSPTQYEQGTQRATESAAARMCQILLRYDIDNFYLAIRNILQRHLAHATLCDICTPILKCLPRFRAAITRLNLEDSKFTEFANNAAEEVFGLLSSYMSTSTVCRLMQTCKLMSASKTLLSRRPVLYWTPTPAACHVVTALSDEELDTLWSTKDDYTESLTFRSGVQIPISFQFGARKADAWLSDLDDQSKLSPISTRDTFIGDLHTTVQLVFDSLNREPVPKTSSGQAMCVPSTERNFDAKTGGLRFKTMWLGGIHSDDVDKYQQLAACVVFSAVSHNYQKHVRFELRKARETLDEIEDALLRRQRKQLIEELEERNKDFQHFRVKTTLKGKSKNQRPVCLVSYSPPFVLMSKKRKAEDRKERKGKNRA
jgi:hypothetical protein